MPPKKRMLTLKEKMEIVNVIDKEKLSTRAIASRFHIGKTQATLIAKNKEDIRRLWQSGVNEQQKRSFCKTEGLNIDKACFEWFVSARNRRIPISGGLVKEKAKEIAQKFGYQKFSASDGWLQKWRKRNNVSFKCISGEAADVNQETVDAFIEKLPSLLLGYQCEDVYNADESGLFFRALPDKTLALKSEKCSGGKLSKERLTVLFCASMTGQKEKLLVIGKSARPRALKNVSIKDLPVIWKSNKKAWMTREIMGEWLAELDRKMGIENRKILLFLDNAASHPRNLHLKNIKIIFLPPNTTCMCQPLDQGIIQNFKFYYRNQILKHVLSNMDGVKSSSELSKKINVLEGLYFIKTAWQNVNLTTKQNRFRKAGFRKSGQQLFHFDPEDDLPLSVFVTMKRAAEELNIPDNQNLDKFVNID